MKSEVQSLSFMEKKAHSYYFGKDAYENMIKDSKYTSNKELLTIPGAVHTDLYDNPDVIPFLTKFRNFLKKTELVNYGKKY